MTLRLINVKVWKHWKEVVEKKHHGIANIIKKLNHEVSIMAKKYQSIIDQQFPEWRKDYNEAFYRAQMERLTMRKQEEEQAMECKMKRDAYVQELEQLLQDEREKNAIYEKEIECLNNRCKAYKDAIQQKTQHLISCQGKLQQYETTINSFFKLATINN